MIKKLTSRPLVLASFCSLIVLNVCSMSLMAQTNTASMHVQRAAKILNDDESETRAGSQQDKARLRALLAQFNSLKGNFTQTIVDMQGEVLQSASGELRLQKPQKLKWAVTLPDESFLIADGTSVYNIDPFLEQVTILDQAPLTRSNPLMLLISDDAQQWNKVMVSQVRVPQMDAKEQGSAYEVVSLEANSPIERLTLRFDSEDTLMSLVSYDRQQQLNKLIFTNVVLDTGVSNQDFIYENDTGFIIDDQREPPITQ